MSFVLSTGVKQSSTTVGTKTSLTSVASAIWSSGKIYFKKPKIYAKIDALLQYWPLSTKE